MHTNHGRMLTRCFVNGAINWLDAFINECALSNAHSFPQGSCMNQPSLLPSALVLIIHGSTMDIID